MPDREQNGNFERSAFWAVLALDLTIAARDTYVPQSEDVVEPHKLRAYNEMLHSICSHLVALQTGHESYSDKSLFDVLHDQAEHGGVLGPLKWAIEDAEQKSAKGS